MSQLFPEKPEVTPVTDNEWAELFEKVAEESSPSSPIELQRTIREQFHDNPTIERKYNKWLEKIAFDRNKLREIFKK